MICPLSWLKLNTISYLDTSLHKSLKINEGKCANQGLVIYVAPMSQGQKLGESIVFCSENYGMSKYFPPYVHLLFIFACQQRQLHLPLACIEKCVETNGRQMFGTELDPLHCLSKRNALLISVLVFSGQSKTKEKGDVILIICPF